MSATRQASKQQSNWLNELWQTYIASGDVTALLVTIILLLMPAFALDAADWPIDLNMIVPTIVMSLLFGYVLARSRYNELYALLVSSLYGIIFVIGIATLTTSLNPIRGLENVIIRSIQWFLDAFTGGINQDSLVFSMIVSLLLWFFGYNAAWHIFRVDRVWRVIIPPAVILLMNMIVYAGDANLDLYLMTFALMSLLLIVRSNLEAREWDWYVNGVRVPQRLRRQFIAVGTGISLVALVIAWAIPTGNLQQGLDNFQRFLASDPIRDMSEFWNRLIEPIESEGPATADYYGGDSLNLGGAIQLGDQVIMLIDAPTENRYYWRSRVFERYDDGRWRPSATRRVPDLDAPIDILIPVGSDLGRLTVEQTITMNSPSRLIYTAPQPLSIDLAGRIDLLRTNGDQDDADSPMNVSVIRPERVIERGVSYDATSAMSVASAIDLRQAGTNYPEWVTSPNTNAVGVSARTAELARQIITDANATNPYDQAKAIERYLRENITYNESIPAPPAGVDPIDWFLFTQQEGYCTYYATSMVAMLRSLGIPARMAAGFAEGEYDASLGQYVVRERDAHTWVEVYFPGYGWVEFEPTSAQAPLNRDGDDIEPEQSNPAGAEPTSVPTFTPTPLPSPTFQPTATPEGSEQQDNQAPPTVTPSPTATATPIIVPTVAPPVAPPDPPNNSFLSFLLPAIGLAFAVFMFVLVIVLLSLLVFWWWEWRGMRGLSPVSRAYARLMRYLGLLGLQSKDDETPEERRKRLVRELPKAERSITAITRNYTIERYSNKDEGTAENARQNQIAENAWVDARRNILVRWIRKFIPFLKD
ncbi:MAG: transglutaminaseTgpA domain-containing protein [Phototrophicaceae bacterium]